MNKVELVVFDIAGTTVKDKGEVAKAFQATLESFGYSVPVEQINPLMGYKKSEAIRLLLNEYEENTDKITTRYIDKIHHRFQEMMMAYYTDTASVEALPYAEELFEELEKRKIKRGLTTGFPKPVTDVILNRLGWKSNGLIDAVVSSSEVPLGRPYPYMIQQLMYQTKVEKATAVVKVGDTEVDVHEGKNAGCLYSVGITTGAFTRNELEAHNPSFIIDGLNELLPLIDKN